MSNHIGRETFLEVEGKKYRLSRFTRKLMGQFLDWADKVLPHPLDTIRGQMEGFTPDLQEIMVREAIAAARLRRSLSSPEVQTLMARPEGVLKIISLLLNQFHPELTEADVDRIYEACSVEHGPDYLAVKIGETNGNYQPEEKDEDSFRGKEEA